MTAAATDPTLEGEPLMTVDELATAAGLTVRNTRYYAGLGLLPPPVRRGRMAYYHRMHLAHLELVRALQDHGFTLQAIERVVARLPEDATTEDLALQRAMLTSWTTTAPEELDRAGLEARAGRALTDDEVDLLVAMGGVDAVAVDEGLPARYVASANLGVGLELLALDVSAESLGAASEAIAWKLPPQPREKLREAANAVGLLDDALLPGGLDALLTRGGGNLSGGQKLRISVARALLAGRTVIADEPTAKLDAGTAGLVRKALVGMAHSHLVVVATHDRELAAASRVTIDLSNDGTFEVAA